MKSKITVTKKNNRLNFFLHTADGLFFLFSQNFSKGVYQFFCKGKSETELYDFKKWNRNPRLDKTIEKLATNVTSKNVAGRLTPRAFVYRAKLPSTFAFARCLYPKSGTANRIQKLARRQFL